LKGLIIKPFDEYLKQGVFMFVVIHEKKLNKKVKEINIIDKSVSKDFAFELLDMYARNLSNIEEYTTKIVNHTIIEVISFNEYIRVSEIKEDELIKLKNLMGE
jgi:hypothetical protein